MAEVVEKSGAAAAAAQELQVPKVEEEVVVVPLQLPPAPTVAASVEKEAPVPEPETEEEAMKPKLQVDQENVEVSRPSKDDGGDEKVPASGSFQEESNKVADLPDSEKKALRELKQLVQEALNKHEFSCLTAAAAAAAAAPAKEEENKEAVAAEEEKPAAEEAIPVQPTAEKPAETKADDEVVAETKDKEEEKVEMVENDVVSAEEKMAATTTNAETDPVEDDDAKTVEAIEETIVAVSSSNPQPQEHKESEAKAAPETDKQVNKEVTSTTPEEVSIWGVPLLADERSDVILLKFLRARDFKVRDAFTMLKNTIRWRKDFGIDELLEQDLGNDLEDKVVFMHGFDKEGHPVCYNVYGEFQCKELYQKTFSDEGKRQRFLRWRIQFLERSIRKLDFTPGGISTIVQINDLKNSPGPGKWELRQATKQALQLLQDNYPEFVAKQIFINVPWWYLAVNKMISPFLTQRTRSKFVFAGPSKSAETLCRYIAAEQIPVKYGGLSKDGEFGTADAVTEITVRPAAKHTVEFPVTETCLLTWEVRVVGWEVSYAAEFVPSAEDSYTVIIQKARKVAATEGPLICNNFKTGEPGKVVITIDNPTSKKKKLLYRLKTKPSSD